MTDLTELHRLNAEATQKIIAKRLCNLMDDEWKLGRVLYMEVAKEILVSIEFPELLAKAEAHEALVAENERIKKHAESALKAAVEVKAFLAPPSQSLEASMSVENLISQLRDAAKFTLADTLYSQAADKLEELAAALAHANHMQRLTQDARNKAEASLTEKDKGIAALKRDLDRQISLNSTLINTGGTDG